MPFSQKMLDVYPPERMDEKRRAPVMVIVPTATLPMSITSDRRAYMTMAMRMRELGYCVVVPTISFYPEERIRQSVIDLRLALSWVGAHIFHYGGDPLRIYLFGMGESAELVSLTLVQEAAVMSRTVRRPEDNHESLTEPNSVAETEQQMFENLLELYAPQVRLPSIAGVVLVAGISDIVKCHLNESKLGIEHISALRRWAGPRQFQCLLHSPTHVLMNTKKRLDPMFLPRKFLLVHGGNDKFVPVSQAVLLQSLLQESGVELVKLLAYRDMDHFDALRLLLTYPARSICKYDTAIWNAIYDFVD